MRIALVMSLLCVLFSTASADRRARRAHRRPHWTQPAPAPALTAGAIAYSPSTGMIGWSYGQPDQETARWTAINACGQSDCEWRASELGAFAVLVLGAGGAYSAWDHTLAGASQRALELCSASTTGCTVVRWVSN